MRVSGQIFLYGSPHAFNPTQVPLGLAAIWCMVLNHVDGIADIITVPLLPLLCVSITGQPLGPGNGGYHGEGVPGHPLRMLPSKSRLGPVPWNVLGAFAAVMMAAPVRATLGASCKFYNDCGPVGLQLIITLIRWMNLVVSVRKQEAIHDDQG
jgi:hypothetical protein